MGGRISAAVGRAVTAGDALRRRLRRRMSDAKIGAAWRWQGLILGAVVFAFSVLLGLRGIWRRLEGRWAIMALAITIPLAIFGFQTDDAWQKAMNKPHAERAAGAGPAREEEKVEKGRQTGEAAKDGARTDEWRRGVEAALKEAEAKQAGGTGGAEIIARTENKPQEEEASATGQTVMKQDAEAAKETNPFADSPVTDRPQTNRVEGPVGVIPFVKPEGTPFWQLRGQAVGRRYSRAGHYSWLWLHRNHVTGVAR